MPPSGSDGPGTGQPDAGDPTAGPPTDLGEGDGSDVVTVGDSWMARDAIEGSLDTVTGRTYRHHAVPTVRLLAATPPPSIPSQWDAAVRQDANIKTVIMTGGGNDILESSSLITDCERGGSRCADRLAEIVDALSALWAEMAAAGVEDVVYVAYANDASSAGQSLADTERNGIAAACAAAALRCHIQPTTDLVRGQYLSDGVHPVKAGYVRIAEAVYDLMTRRGMRR